MSAFWENLACEVVRPDRSRDRGRRRRSACGRSRAGAVEAHGAWHEVGPCAVADGDRSLDLRRRIRAGIGSLGALPDPEAHGIRHDGDPDASRFASPGRRCVIRTANEPAPTSGTAKGVGTLTIYPKLYAQRVECDPYVVASLGEARHRARSDLRLLARLQDSTDLGAESRWRWRLLKSSSISTSSRSSTSGSSDASSSSPAAGTNEAPSLRVPERVRRPRGAKARARAADDPSIALPSSAGSCCWFRSGTVSRVSQGCGCCWAGFDLAS